MSRLAPVLSVSPCRGLVDEKLTVLVENLPPGLPVTLHSLHLSEDNDYWEAFGHYVSDHRGVVSVADDISFGGTYTGIEAMGLLWSMRPVPDGRQQLRLRRTNVCSPLLISISVYAGHQAEGFRKLCPLSSSVIERWYVAPGVKRVSVRERGVRGTLFIPPGPGPFPGVLDMWGGGGGLVEYRSAMLASHGYVSLALEYLSAEEMASAGEEFHYFETAFSLLQEHPQVVPDRVALFGLSLGCIISLCLAAESSVAKPFCCVGISGSHLRPEGEKISEVSRLFETQADKIIFDESGHQIWRGLGLAVMHDSDKVDVGKINCPFLLINGTDDQNWPAVECSEDISQRMKAAGKEHLLTVLEYPEAGHLIEPPYSPHFRVTNFKKNVKLVWGGKTKPHSEAQEDAWRKMLAFLQAHLYSSGMPRAKM
ncbi:peroxisomal succinyl-coenzyme A thioesterase-like isoform X1 [Nelusetta ayraudi]|uniref:peroxisomal succinyl-coenzyme A thioesterase-like isoform X1 n=1 Tax=Nelusetta ayraudi TaxID=303726 RepID=UPI003F72B592